MKNILVTGSNRGIGYELVNQLSLRGDRVFATCRNPTKADNLQKLAKVRSNLTIHTLDVTKDNEIERLYEEFHQERLDWIINNAGISGVSNVTVNNINRENFLQVFNINCLSALKVSDYFLPLLGNEDKLIVCISSKMGSIAENIWGHSFAYRTSKAALNCAMRSFALDVEERGVQVMLLHPGWVKTDLGGPEALIEPTESVNGLLMVIEKYKSNSHAEVLRGYNDEVIPW